MSEGFEPAGPRIIHQDIYLLPFLFCQILSLSFQDLCSSSFEVKTGSDPWKVDRVKEHQQ